jgi:hypothetical protein
MADAWHRYGGDLAVGPTGDIALADGALLGQQRVLRRLLTGPGDYIWQLDYGAGLGQFVGQPAVDARIEAVIRGQVFREAAVARRPQPTVAVTDDGAGAVFAQVTYADAGVGAPQMLTFSLNG